MVPRRERAARNHRILTRLAAVAVLAVALFVRLYRLTWDQGFLFHPDERQILFVTADLSFPWPPDWRALLSPASPWNPGFFAYGSLPIYLLRISASLAARVWPEMASPRSFYVIGRFYSALADAGSVALLLALGRQLYDDTVGLLGAALLAFTVLHVQLAHFYAVDTLLTFFILLSLYLAVRAARQPSGRRWVGVGAALGAALATKVSAAPLALPLGLASLGAATLGEGLHGPAALGRAVRSIAIIGAVALLVFVICQPYAVIDARTFVEDLVREGEMASGAFDLPYTRQFIGRPRYVYLLQQTVVWSLGVPLGVTGLAGAAAALAQGARLALRRRWTSLLAPAIPLSWFLAYGGIVGSFHAKFLRYMLPVIPLLCLWGAAALIGLVRARRALVRGIGIALAGLVLLASGLYTAAYLHVYASVHPWVQATEWICAHVPHRSVLLIEHWDNPLPMPQGRDELDCWLDYRYITLNGFNPDDTAKLEQLLFALRASDYIMISSNRLYNSIPRLPERYPLMTRYYELLMAEQLGFELVYFAQVYPELAGVRLVDDTFRDPPLPMPRLLAEQGRRPTDLVLGRADESYSVYDHPMPLIFRRTETLSREELLERLGASARGLPVGE